MLFLLITRVFSEQKPCLVASQSECSSECSNCSTELSNLTSFNDFLIVNYRSDLAFDCKDTLFNGRTVRATIMSTMTHQIQVKNFYHSTLFSSTIYATPSISFVGEIAKIVLLPPDKLFEVPSLFINSEFNYLIPLQVPESGTGYIAPEIKGVETNKNYFVLHSGTLVIEGNQKYSHVQADVDATVQTVKRLCYCHQLNDKCTTQCGEGLWNGEFLVTNVVPYGNIASDVELVFMSDAMYLNFSTLNWNDIKTVISEGVTLTFGYDFGATLTENTIDDRHFSGNGKVVLKMPSSSYSLNVLSIPTFHVTLVISSSVKELYMQYHLTTLNFSDPTVSILCDETPQENFSFVISNVDETNVDSPMTLGLAQEIMTIGSNLMNKIVLGFCLATTDAGKATCADDVHSANSRLITGDYPLTYSGVPVTVVENFSPESPTIAFDRIFSKITLENNSHFSFLGGSSTRDTSYFLVDESTITLTQYSSINGATIKLMNVQFSGNGTVDVPITYALRIIGKAFPKSVKLNFHGIVNNLSLIYHPYGDPLVPSEGKALATVSGNETIAQLWLVSSTALTDIQKLINSSLTIQIAPQVCFCSSPFSSFSCPSSSSLVPYDELTTVSSSTIVHFVDGKISTKSHFGNVHFNKDLLVVVDPSIKSIETKADQVIFSDVLTLNGSSLLTVEISAVQSIALTLDARQPTASFSCTGNTHFVFLSVSVPDQAVFASPYPFSVTQNAAPVYLQTVTVPAGHSITDYVTADGLTIPAQACVYTNEDEQKICEDQAVAGQLIMPAGTFPTDLSIPILIPASRTIDFATIQGRTVIPLNSEVNVSISMPSDGTQLLLSSSNLTITTPKALDNQTVIVKKADKAIVVSNSSDVSLTYNGLYSGPQVVLSLTQKSTNVNLVSSSLQAGTVLAQLEKDPSQKDDINVAFTSYFPNQTQYFTVGTGITLTSIKRYCLCKSNQNDCQTLCNVENTTNIIIDELNSTSMTEVLGMYVTGSDFSIDVNDAALKNVPKIEVGQSYTITLVNSSSLLLSGSEASVVNQEQKSTIVFGQGSLALANPLPAKSTPFTLEITQVYSGIPITVNVTSTDGSFYAIKSNYVPENPILTFTSTTDLTSYFFLGNGTLEKFVSAKDKIKVADAKGFCLVSDPATFDHNLCKFGDSVIPDGNSTLLVSEIPIDRLFLEKYPIVLPEEKNITQTPENPISATFYCKANATFSGITSISDGLFDEVSSKYMLKFDNMNVRNWEKPETVAVVDAILSTTSDQKMATITYSNPFSLSPGKIKTDPSEVNSFIRFKASLKAPEKVIGMIESSQKQPTFKFYEFFSGEAINSTNISSYFTILPNNSTVNQTSKGCFATTQATCTSKYPTAEWISTIDDAVTKSVIMPVAIAEAVNIIIPKGVKDVHNFILGAENVVISSVNASVVIGEGTNISNYVFVADSTALQTVKINFKSTENYRVELLDGAANYVPVEFSNSTLATFISVALTAKSKPSKPFATVPFGGITKVYPAIPSGANINDYINASNIATVDGYCFTDLNLFLSLPEACNTKFVIAALCCVRYPELPVFTVTNTYVDLTHSYFDISHKFPLSPLDDSQTLKIKALSAENDMNRVIINGNVITIGKANISVAVGKVEVPSISGGQQGLTATIIDVRTMPTSNLDTHLYFVQKSQFARYQLILPSNLEASPNSDQITLASFIGSDSIKNSLTYFDNPQSSSYFAFSTNLEPEIEPGTSGFAFLGSAEEASAFVHAPWQKVTIIADLSTEPGAETIKSATANANADVSSWKTIHLYSLVQKTGWNPKLVVSNAGGIEINATGLAMKGATNGGIQIAEGLISEMNLVGEVLKIKQTSKLQKFGPLTINVSTENTRIVLDDGAVHFNDKSPVTITINGKGTLEFDNMTQAEYDLFTLTGGIRWANEPVPPTPTESTSGTTITTKSKSNLSGGQVAGIVIGVIILLIVAVVIVILLIKRRNPYSAMRLTKPPLLS